MDEWSLAKVKMDEVEEIINDTWFKLGSEGAEEQISVLL